MQSLNAKVIFAFVVVCLVEALLVAILMRESTRRSFDQFIREDAIQLFIQDVTAYYENNGSFDGLSAELISTNLNQSNRRIPRLAPPKKGPPGSDSINRGTKPRYGLADTLGNLIISNGDFKYDETLSPSQLETGKPLIIGGTIRGIILLPSENLPPSPQEINFLTRTDHALLGALLGALTIALILGVWFARTYTRPIRELTLASQAISQDEPLPPIPVRTQDELGDLTKAFNHMADNLAKTKALRRQMTADIAHELGTPLTVIRGYLEAMVDGDLKPNQNRLETMHLEAVHLQRLVEDVRLLSLADAGELSLTLEKTSLNDLLKRVKSAFNHKSKDTQVQIEATFDNDLPHLKIDAGRLFQALSNLVSNALRYTPAGGKIELSVTQEVDSIVISVKDTGSGIDPDVLPYIFDRFYKADKSRQGHLESTGLGLAIVKSIVEAHNASIQVNSEQGNGTIFIISLPKDGL